MNKNGKEKETHLSQNIEFISNHANRQIRFNYDL